MPRSSIRIVVILLALAGMLSSCNKKMSTDEPLPPVYYPSIFISSDNEFVYSFDPSNGNKHWEYNVGDVVIASPLLYNEMLYVATVNGVVFKLNAKSGALVSKINIPSKLIATPVADKNLIYFASTNDTLYAMDTTTGKAKWKYGTGKQLQSSPTIEKGNIIFASYDGNVYSLNDATGVINWIYSTGGTDSFYSSPCIGHAVHDSSSHPLTTTFVYVGGLSGAVYEINAADGSLRWKFQTQAAVKSSPTIFGGNCVVGSNDFRIYCIDTVLGTKRWAESTFYKVISSPFADANTQAVFAGSCDYNLYAVNILDGTTKWKFPSPSGSLFMSSPLVYNGLVYIGGFDQYLYAIRASTGDLVWKQNINGLIECSPVIDDLSGTNSFNSSISGLSQ